jgi:hypothetical protein
VIGLVVLGMHRSGTSAVARTFSLLGADLPKRLVQASAHNTAGHWEPEAIVKLHDELFGAAGGSWDEIAGLALADTRPFAERIARVLRADFARSSLFVLKDPRMCLLVPMWRSLLAELGAQPRFVLPLRHPLAVAGSLADRNRFSVEKSLLLWLRHVLAAERDTRGAARVFLEYDALLADPTRALATVTDTLAITWPRDTADSRAELARFLSTQLRHHAAPSQPLDSDWLRDTWDASRALCRNPNDPRAQATLDRIAAELARADQLFLSRPTPRRFDPANTTVLFPLFNDGWNETVANTQSQSHQPLAPAERAAQLPRYLDYLAGALASFHQHHGDADLSVLLIRISEHGLTSEQLARFLADRVPQARCGIVEVPLDNTRPFLDEARALPEGYRPPNRLHEFALLNAIRTSRREWLALCDVDLLFKSPALWQIGAALAARPDKCIAAFVEPGRPQSDGGPAMRERMHTMLLLAHAPSFSSFPFDPFLRASPLEDRLATLSSADTRDLYRRCNPFDRARTLCLVSERLRETTDRILDLSTVIPNCTQGARLTITSDWLTHEKYLER